MVGVPVTALIFVTFHQGPPLFQRVPPVPLCQTKHGMSELGERDFGWLSHFKPAFLGRTTIVPYYPLNDSELSKITEIALNRIKKKLAEQYQASFIWDESFIEFIVSKNTDPTTGGRAVEQIINRSLMPKLAEECIARLSKQEPITQVEVKRANSALGFELTIN